MPVRQMPVRQIATAAALLTAVLASVGEAQTLVKFASLDADTFAPGPTSGQLIAPANGRVPPFVNQQPVQGFSSVLRGADNDFLVMSDNGFGNKANSPDYVLRVSRISPDFRTATGGTGAVTVEEYMVLSDPNDLIPFPIVAEGVTYPGSTIPVDPAISSRRLLTGGDFDIESMRQGVDGTFWFGDEFGPFLLHTDRRGRLLEAPIPLPGVSAPQNPFLGSGTPNLATSKGFEGMAQSRDGWTLYPMLEGALTTDTDQRRLIISEFDIPSRRYTGEQWLYRLESPAHAIGDLTTVGKNVMLVIERDNLQGEPAAVKKLFLVDLTREDADGFLVKTEVADLLNLADPLNLSGVGPAFEFPFQTIESVLALNERELVVLNDNNYPFSSGRTPGQSDPNEIIVIRLEKPLASYLRPRK